MSTSLSDWARLSCVPPPAREQGNENDCFTIYDLRNHLGLREIEKSDRGASAVCDPRLLRPPTTNNCLTLDGLPLSVPKFATGGFYWCLASPTVREKSIHTGSAVLEGLNRVLTFRGECESPQAYFPNGMPQSCNTRLQL